MRLRFALFGVALSTLAALAQDAPRIGPVSIDRGVMNPAIGDSVRISAAFPRTGRATVAIVDRDGVIVRTLANEADVRAGKNEFVWNGRDASGEVVPDEAYSLKIDWTGDGVRAWYFPANRAFEMKSVPIKYYDRRGGTLAFDLPSPSRVHVQAGAAVMKNGTAEGPVMKTVVNREPRVAGSIAEHWNGLDESGTTYVPDLPHFVIAVAATPLAENSIITTGNRQRTFVELAAARGEQVRSVFTFQTEGHAHHAGLPTLGDVSPGLVIEPVGGKWSEADRTWSVPAGDVKLRVTLAGPTASAFAKQPAKVHRFVDARLVGTSSADGTAELTVRIPKAKLAGTVRMVSVNWQSEYGGVAANTIRLRVNGGGKS
ncbi:MAG TPA: FlgD immunoglobulin-like domain containing protein [Thermoanaerobaculia bacterium]|nr:FlgD immunoglobulin-like domain containing protein [Thermoanaerobaculia bacterium]